MVVCRMTSRRGSEGEEEMLEDEACCSEFREKMSRAVGGRKGGPAQTTNKVFDVSSVNQGDSSESEAEVV